MSEEEFERLADALEFHGMGNDAADMITEARRAREEVKLYKRALAEACEDYNTTDSERSAPVDPEWYLARAKESEG